MNFWNILYTLYVFVLCDIFRIWGHSDGQLYPIRNSLLILSLNNFVQLHCFPSMLLGSVHWLLNFLNLNFGLFLKQLLSDITVNIWWMSFRALSYTLINLLHGYPYFCFEIFVLAEILPRTCTIWLFRRERLGASSMFLWVCVVMRSSLVQWVWLCVPVFVFVTDCLCVPILVYGSVCSNLGIWVWLCVPILVYVSDCVFQFWSVCLTLFSILGLSVRLCSIFCLYLRLSVCSSTGLSVWLCVPNFVSMIQFLSMCQAVRLKSFCQWWYGIVFIFVSSMLFDWYSIDVKMIFKWNVEFLYDLCLMCHIDLSYLQRNPICYKYLYQLY